MGEFSVDVIQIRDSSFNIGLSFGKYLRNNPFLNVLEAITKPEIDYKSLKSIYTALAPHLLEELEGLASGLEISTKKSQALFSGYDVPKTEAMGCSAMITKDYYVRNYDFSQELYDGIFSLVQPKTAFATAGYNLQMLGRHDGVNQNGLVVGLHFVSNSGYKRGISSWTSTRMVLDMCSTVDDAIQLLKEIPHAACYNFSIGDQNGAFAVVEASPEKVLVRKGVSTIACVNHFQKEELKNKNRQFIENSVKRNQYLQEISSKNLSYQELFAHFKDKHSPLFFRDYENLFGTLHTLAYSFGDSRILTTIAQGEHVLDINFEDWVAGKNLEEQTLRGMIE